ncbi:MAG: hypothetical protein CL608_20455 [Anaerolineaceae bacterium]|nr:hypothetical protein [Anaerolineaceae bacterium]
MYQKILVPLDGSSVPEETIPNALELCHLSKGMLTLVRVIPSATQPPALYSMTNAETWFTRQRQRQAEAEGYLAEIAARPELAEADPRRLAIAGVTDQSLLTLIEQGAFDILGDDHS